VRNNKLRIFLLAIALAVMTLTFPTFALADEGDNVITLMQEDFDATGGTYYISTTGGSYKLGESITGSLKFTTTDRGAEINFDLGGFTLADDAGLNTVSIEGLPPRINLRNGKLVSNGGSAIKSSYGQTDLRVYNVEASSTNHTCVEAARGRIVLCQGCSATLTITDESASGEALFTKGKTGDILVLDGTYKVIGDGYGIIKADSNDEPNFVVRLGGGEYSSFPDGAWMADGFFLVARAGDGTTPSSYAAMQRYYAAKAASCYVESGIDRLGNVYFESKDEAKIWAISQGLDPETAIHDQFQVTFDTDGGSEAPESQTLEYGQTATRPADPTKDNYRFVQWVVQNDIVCYRWDFGRGVTRDLSLKAEWTARDPIAEMGGKKYASVQDAVDASDGAATITLLKDSTECVTIAEGKDITLDLGGNTITAAASEDGNATRAISVMGSAKLSVTNGSLAASGNCVYVDGAATGAEVSLDLDSATSSADSVVSTGAGKLTIIGGTYEVAKGGNGYALSLFNGSNPECEVYDGKFVVPEGQTSSVCVDNASQLSVMNGEFAGGIAACRDSDVVIMAGAFGSADNAASVVEGKRLFKRANGAYEVTDADEAKRGATCVATDGRSGAKAYFENEGEGTAYAEGHPQAGFAKVHEVTFVLQGKTVGETLYLEDGEAYGELPAGEEVFGYTFAGWFVNGDASKRVTAGDAPTFELDHEVTLVAMWTRDGSDEPAADPAPYDKELPQTGDVAGTLGLVAAAGAALGSIGVVRRRK
jgi:LPXTG-motif cell wall-anchored protein